MRLTDSQTGRAALCAAAAATVLAPIHALARFATEDGKSDLESGVVRAWAEPAADGLSPLLTWASADTVYTTYGKLWAPLFLAALLCALAVRRGRDPRGAEKWGWRLHLVGLAGVTVGVTGSYWTPLLDEFFFLSLPFLLVSLVGGTTLGVSLLRQGFRPRTTPWLLVLWFPLLFIGSDVIAMGAGFLPVMWAWGAAGYALAAGTTPITPRDATVPSVAATR